MSRVSERAADSKAWQVTNGVDQSKENKKRSEAKLLRWRKDALPEERNEQTKQTNGRRGRMENEVGRDDIFPLPP